jgi:hypothetical protein
LVWRNRRWRLGVRRQTDRQEDGRMVLERLAHGQVCLHLDLEILQVRRGADARAHEDGRRAHRAGSQDHLAAAHLAPAAGDVRAHADGAVLVEHHPVDERLAEDGQVVAPSGWLDIGVVGADADAIAAVDRVGRDAGRPWRVVVSLPGIARVQRGFSQRLVDGAPFRDRRAIDGDRPCVAVIVGGGEAQVGLQPVERRQHLGEGPPCASGGGPAVIVLGHAADGDLAVDRRAAAHAPASPVGARRLRARAPRVERVPAEAGVGLADDDLVRVGAAHRLGRVGRAIVRPGLDQRDLGGRVGG